MRKSKAVTLTVMLAVLVPTVATLPSCAGGNAIEPMQVAAIARGSTTKAEVIQSLGDPDKTTDLGGGKEELLYVREDVANHGNWLHPNYKALWIVCKNNIVEAYGERATDETPKRTWWPF